MKPGSKAEHDRIVVDTLILLGREAHKICRAFNNPTGVAYRQDSEKKVWIKYGVVGSGDIYGFLIGGRIFYIEIKSGAARQSREQLNFQAMCQKFGALYWVCRTPQEALRYVLNAAAFRSN